LNRGCFEAVLMKNIRRTLGVKKAFTLALILVHVDSLKPFFLEANASNFAIDIVLS
jgi:hypothetical protein